MTVLSPQDLKSKMDNFDVMYSQSLDLGTNTSVQVSNAPKNTAKPSVAPARPQSKFKPFL